MEESHVNCFKKVHSNRTILEPEEQKILHGTMAFQNI